MKWFRWLFLVAATAQAEGQLTLEVKDADTGKPMAARISMQVSGNLYPGDRIGNFSDQWPNIDAHGVFIEGRKTFQLPDGPVHIAASHGAEYRVARTNVVIKSEQSQAVQIALKRFINLRELGWVCGDAHMHMIHGARKRDVDFDDVALTCNAGGLDWAYVNQGYVGAGQLDLAGYNAECARVSTDDFKLFIGGERPKSLLGHLAIIGAPDPFTVRDDPPYYIGAREVHRQGGVLYYVHPIRYYPGKTWKKQWLDFPGNNMARELLFDMHLGPSFDALSVLSDEPNRGTAHQLWFNLLNRGLFVPVMADSDAVFDRPMLGKGAPGFWLSYVNIGPDAEVGHATIAEGIRKGRTFASSGPLLLIDIDGAISGATIPADGKPHTLNILAWHPHNHWTLSPTAMVANVELIRNGRVVHTWTPEAPAVELQHEIVETENCWYTVRINGDDKRWQSAMASPIYFGHTPRKTKQPVTQVEVTGRVYDFKDGKPRDGAVVVARAGEILERHPVKGGTFQVKMPLDASIEVEGAVKHELLMGYQPIHQFLWNLTSPDLGKVDTLIAFDALLENIELEFPMGYVNPGSYVVGTGNTRVPVGDIKLLDAPARKGKPGIYVASIVMDTVATRTGDTIHAAALFQWTGEGEAPDMELTIIGSGYDPARPSGYGALKRFDLIEQRWSKARDLGKGYRMISGTLTVADWVRPGPMRAIDISVRARMGSDATSLVGLEIPFAGEPKRALSLSSAWPTMPLSWHDHNYGIGPTKICGKLGYRNQPAVDYRHVHLQVLTPRRVFDLWPARDGEGCADAQDAVYQGQFFDQVLSAESGIGLPPEQE